MSATSADPRSSITSQGVALSMAATPKQYSINLVEVALL